MADESQHAAHADRATLADLAERAKVADVAEAAVRLIEQRSRDGGVIVRKSGEEVRASNGVNGVKHWIHELLSPTTILWGIVLLTAAVGSWVSLSSWRAGFEAATNVRINALEVRVGQMDTDHHRDLQAAISDRNERIKELKSDFNQRFSEVRADTLEADHRLWEDIKELRSHK